MRNRLVRGIITRGDWCLLGLAIGLLLAFFAFGWHSVTPLIPVIGIQHMTSDMGVS